MQCQRVFMSIQFFIDLGIPGIDGENHSIETFLGLTGLLPATPTCGRRASLRRCLGRSLTLQRPSCGCHDDGNVLCPGI
jgi:hypothetical protein